MSKEELTDVSIFCMTCDKEIYFGFIGKDSAFGLPTSLFNKATKKNHQGHNVLVRLRSNTDPKKRLATV